MIKTVKDLVAELLKYDPETEIGGVVVSYIDHGCSSDEPCYCTEDDHEFHSIYVNKEEKPGKYKDKGKVITKIWIRGI